MEIARFRARMPLIAFGDRPALALERALRSPALPAAHPGRGSPEFLQRFLL